MKVAIIGSREINIESIERYVPKEMTELISGGARGVDRKAEKYAEIHNISKKVILPDYERYGKSAPLVRNREIVENAEIIVAIWDGHSRGTKYTIDYAKSIGKCVKLIMIDTSGIELTPGKFGKECRGNGEHYNGRGRIECCCDECDYLQCCIDESFPDRCITCKESYCPRQE